MKIEIGNHWIGHIGSLQVHVDTLLMAWFAMIVIILLAFIVTRKLNIVPGDSQSVSEMIMGFLESISTGEIGENGLKHAPIISSLFLFILFANLEGQIPWRLYHLQHGEFTAPTSDINTTVGLALVVSVYYIGAGLLTKGFGYFKNYLRPLWFMLPFNILEDFTRPLSLSLRLFGNILAGELIILILLSLIPVFATVPMMLFELFVAFLQAYIFSVLAAHYISAAISDEH